MNAGRVPGQAPNPHNNSAQTNGTYPVPQSSSAVLSDEQRYALDIARGLIKAGVPVFAAPPDPTNPSGFRLPLRWQDSVPSLEVVDDWQPGWALCAVGGHVVDFLDTDPRNGGDKGSAEMRAAGEWPCSYGQASTPSGGTHDLIASLRIKKGKPAEGIDLQAGAPDGSGRGFVFIAPTERRSKVAPHDVRPYRWLTRPNFEALSQYATTDNSGEALRNRLLSPVNGAAKPSSLAHTELRATGTAPTAAEVAYAQAGIRGACETFTHVDDERRGDAAWTFACRLVELANLGGIAIDAVRDAYMSAYASSRANRPGGYTDHEALINFDRALDYVGARAAEMPADPLAPYETRPFGGAQVGAWPAPTSEMPPAEVGGTPDRVAAMRAELIDSDGLDSIQPLRPLVSGLLFVNSVARIFGASGHGKSLVTLDVAGCVATNTDWHGKATTPGEVIYIVAEGIAGMRLRVRAWEERYGRKMTGVRFLPRPVQANSPEWDDLTELCRQLRPIMIVVDTQARVTVGVEENSNTEMGVFVDRVEKMRAATEACVILVHHTGHDGERSRGASNVYGALQSELKVTRTGVSVKVSTTKQKDSEELGPMTFRMTPTPTSLIDEVGMPQVGVTLVSDVAAVVSEVMSQEDLKTEAGRLAALMCEVFSRANGGTKAEVQSVIKEREIKLSKTAFYRAWNECVEMGVIGRIRGTGGWKYVTPEDRERMTECIKDGDKSKGMYAP